MKKGYVLAMLNIDGRCHNFVNGKVSKSKLAQKALIPVDVITNARQLSGKKCVTFKSNNKVTYYILCRGNIYKTGVYVGEHNIYIFSNKIKFD